MDYARLRKNLPVTDVVEDVLDVEVVRDVVVDVVVLVLVVTLVVVVLVVEVLVVLVRLVTIVVSDIANQRTTIIHHSKKHVSLRFGIKRPTSRPARSAPSKTAANSDKKMHHGEHGQRKRL